MPWKPLPSVAFAICIYPFRASHPEDLPLQIGDHIYIIEQGGRNSDWYRGYLVAPPSLLAGLTSDRGQQLEHRVFSGIFPRNCVELRELLGENKINGQTQQLSRQHDAIAGAADDGEDAQEKRKSQRMNARRLSRALSRKKSQNDVRTKGRPNLIDANEPMPRDPNAPKPLAPVPLLRVGDETGQSAEEPLVDEIASCLREWHDARLHELLLARGYSQLSRIQELIKRVDTSRKQLMHDVMTNRELNKLHEDTVWDLVAGNKLLSDEVIVRIPNEKGRILTADDSVIEMTKLQANMSILDRPPKAPVDKHMLYHVMVDVRTLVCEYGTPATLQMYLCSKEYGDRPRPISENYAIPVPLPDASYQSPEDQPKTLFINLSATDVGVGADSSSLYLVFKLLKDEPVRLTTSSHGAASHQQRPSLTSTSTAQSRGSLRGRRGVFGSQRKKSDHARSSSEARPMTAQSNHTSASADDRTTTPNSDAPPSRGEVKTVKRTVGIGAIEIGALARQQTELDKRITLWTPASATEDRSDESDDWTEVIRELARSPTGGFARVAAVKRFEIFATAFASADLEALVRNTPTLLHDIHTTQKLGFTALHAPHAPHGAPRQQQQQQRSDIYFTLTEPIIPRNAHLAHSKYGNVPLLDRCKSNLANLQLTLEVRKANGERIEECIYTSSNHQGHTAWRTTGIERGEGWNQTIRLAIPADAVPGSHIVMSIADSPNFPFALAWVPLWEGDASVRDGDHDVQLYVYDEYSSSMIGGKGAYLALPPWSGKGDTGAAVVSVRTYLCSTEYSQDPNLLGLLRWRNYHGAELVQLLERFVYVPDIEVVKLLSDTFAALFEILDEYANSETYEDVVFYNLVVVLTICRDRRFDLGNVIGLYAHTVHDYAYTSQCLIRAYQRLLSHPMDPEASRKLRATLKVGDQMLKLIVETRKEPPKGSGTYTNGIQERHPNFVQDLHSLFVALMALMRNPMPVLLGTQTLVIQHFHAWLPELSDLMPAADILDIATNLLDACAHAQGKMILYRLILIIHLSHLDLFKPAEVRTTLIANTFRWLAPYWGGEAPVVNEQWRNQVRLCCSVVAAQMEVLGEESCQYVPKLVESYRALERNKKDKSSGPSRRAFSLLFPSTFPFPEKKTPVPAAEMEVDEAMLEISALLAAALTTETRLYFDEQQVDVSGMLLQALKVGQSILTGEAFPRSWLSLHVAHHRFAMTALERISEVLIDSLPDIYAPDAAEAFEFDTEIWRAFFDTLFTAVSSPALAMETFPEQKRRAVWKIAGDVRELGANLLRRCWEAIGWETDVESKKMHGFERMGGYQVQFVPELVAPIVKLCLSVHASLRNVATEVLRSMVVSAWEIDQDLAVVQTSMIDCLDRLCREKQVAEDVLQKSFIGEMRGQFEPVRPKDAELHYAVMGMFARIEDLLRLLASVHSGGSAEAGNEATRIMDTLRLMEFLRDVQSDDAYVRYVHQLADLQSKAGNHTEAGLALRLHADRYEWDPATNVEAMKDPEMPAQTAFERKEMLYFRMVQNFERGQSWQRALDTYRELAVQYEQNVFDFLKLARAQRAMASIHERIVKGDRVSARYFRVIYRGLGFPTTLRDKMFIFEANHSERMAAFEDHLQHLHPSAQILRKGVEPDVEGQYLQVFPVSLYKDLYHLVYQRTRISQAVREHCLMSNPSKFTWTDRQIAADVPITDQVVEKTIYTTAESFPTILKRAEITEVENVTLLPIEAAVERTTRKTQELQQFEKAVTNGDTGAMTRLSEAILLSVDDESDSSVARYRMLLPDSETKDTASEEMDPNMLDGEAGEQTLDPLQNALKVALLDHAIVIRRCLGQYYRSAHLATRAELVPRFESTFAHELAILFPGQAGVADQDIAGEELDEPDYPNAQERPDTAQQQATTGATVTEDDTVEEQAPVPEKRQGRRRSLPFLGRRSISSLRGTNGVAREDGSQSRQGSRARDQSLSGRLSFFRSGTEGDARQRGNSVERPDTQATNMSLKKRLSFLANGNA